MAINSQAYASLAKKLAAVRATLDDDERALLDQIVRTADLEGRGARGTNPSTAKPGDAAASDVEAHGMVFSSANADDAAVFDVNAHGMVFAAADSAAAAAAAAGNVAASPASVFMSVYQARARDDNPDVEAHM